MGKNKIVLYIDAYNTHFKKLEHAQNGADFRERAHSRRQTFGPDIFSHGNAGEQIK